MAGPALAKPRKIIKKLLSREQSEGDGARVRRSIGRPELRNLDPFLMLDEFSVQPPAGFPDHPHRGQETVTYMLKGTFTHQDFTGHKGTINPGDVQWMTAGRGIVHSEIPASDDAHGLQLWVNLAAKDKMVEPAYQELLASEIPKAEKDGVSVAVIAGESLGISSPVFTRTPSMYLDFTLQPGASISQPVPEGWNGFAYTLNGTAVFDDVESGPHHTLQLGPGDGIKVENKGAEPARFVLIAGKPLNEPVVQHGPFVMNTREEIMQTFNDYQYGRNGFERAHTWVSS
ncbi:cupin-domain containing protein [Klebsormidium nitens]|uniref:Cupin-domain containing protein n=1 Tax=Klebsormidium nitens TaxID=105231 RepID=A0A1Y1HPA7_KLENI|nr:cupin-domain containing protein [Klebsormidium nitens]|eukprot:GAQ79883.1 cupin-domain containing protein [Klebsormidium nitens]